MTAVLQILLIIALGAQILIWRSKRIISRLKNDLQVAAEDQRILAQRGKMTFPMFVKSFFKDKQ